MDSLLCRSNLSDAYEHWTASRVLVLGDKFHFGAGIHSEIEFSPLFADIRYAFGKEVNRPFVGVKLGMAFFNPEYLFVNPSFGVDFGRVSASLSYVQWNADLKATNGITGHVKFQYFLAGVSFWF